MSLERRTPLKRSPMKRTGAQLARTGIKRKPKSAKAAELEFPADVKAAADRRAGFHCEFPGCPRPINRYHHRKLRKHGGPGTLENCMALCDPHHRHIHDHPSESYAAGWLVHSWGE